MTQDVMSYVMNLCDQFLQDDDDYVEQLGLSDELSCSDASTIANFFTRLS